MGFEPTKLSHQLTKLDPLTAWVTLAINHQNHGRDLNPHGTTPSGPAGYVCQFHHRAKHGNRVLGKPALRLCTLSVYDEVGVTALKMDGLCRSLTSFGLLECSTESSRANVSPGNGSGGRTRTVDLLGMSQMICQLIYPANIVCSI